MSRTYLKKDRLGWFVRVRVPQNIKHIIGKSEIKKTLQTRDYAEALNKRHVVLAGIFRLFEEARNPKPSNSLEALREMAEELRKSQGTQQELTPSELFDLALQQFIRDHYGNPDDPDVRAVIKPQDITSLRNLSQAVSNPNAHLIGDTIKTYLNEKKATITNQTYNTKMRRLDDFATWVGKDSIIETITKRKAGEYATTRLASMKDRYDRQLSTKTKRDTASDLRAFFNWCEGRGYIEVNPFANIMNTMGASIKGKPSSRRGWNRSELVRLLSGERFRKDNKLMSLVVVGLYTGMRGNEIAELRLEDVTPDYLRVVDAKNNNSIRKVPIHNKIAPLVEHLKTTSKDGYLIEGLLRGGEDNKRFHNMSNRFSRLKMKMGFSKDLVFHSLRHSLATALENAGVPRELAEQVAGHSDQNRGLTYSLYSDGLEHDALAETLNKANYGEEVEALIDELILMVKSADNSVVSV